MKTFTGAPLTGADQARLRRLAAKDPVEIAREARANLRAARLRTFTANEKHRAHRIGTAADRRSITITIAEEVAR